MSQFEFCVYNRRRDCELTYRVDMTDTGWDISHIAINGPCSPNGSEFFYMNFDQDNIYYPSGFGDFLEWLWTRLKHKEISHIEAQTKLQELGRVFKFAIVIDSRACTFV